MCELTRGPIAWWQVDSEVPQWPSQNHNNQGQDAIPSYQASFESVPVSCLTPVPWGQQTNRVCLPVSSDIPPDTRPFILNDISSSEITKVTSDHDGLGGAVMDDVSSGPVIIDCQSEMELRLVWPRTQDTSSLLSRMSGLSVLKCIQSKHGGGGAKLIFNMITDFHKMKIWKLF